MRPCTNCGYGLPNNAKHCTRCDASVETVSSTVVQPQEGPSEPKRESKPTRAQSVLDTAFVLAGCLVPIIVPFGLGVLVATWSGSTSLGVVAGGAFFIMLLGFGGG